MPWPRRSKARQVVEQPQAPNELLAGGKIMLIHFFVARSFKIGLNRDFVLSKETAKKIYLI